MSAYRPAIADANGWISWKPGLASYAFGIVCAAIFIFFFRFFVESLIGGLSEDRIFIIIVAPLLMTLMLYGCGLVFLTRLQASEQGVRYRGPRGWVEFGWDEIQGIEDFFGTPSLRIVSGGTFHFWPFGYGAAEVTSLFRERGKFVLL
ncbi:MAG: hypothetical protein WBG08_00665 [Litorimonas sp.]